MHKGAGGTIPVYAKEGDYQSDHPMKTSKAGSFLDLPDQVNNGGRLSKASWDLDILVQKTCMCRLLAKNTSLPGTLRSLSLMMMPWLRGGILRRGGGDL